MSESIVEIQAKAWEKIVDVLWDLGAFRSTVHGDTGLQVSIRFLNSLVAERDTLRAELAKAIAERDAAKKEREKAISTSVALKCDAEAFGRILWGPRDLVITEAESCEPGRTARECRVIDLANYRMNTEAKTRANRELRAELNATRKVIDDSGVVERDSAAPLPERVGRLIVDLKSDRHDAEMDAVSLRQQVDELSQKLADANAVILSRVSWTVDCLTTYRPRPSLANPDKLAGILVEGALATEPLSEKRGDA